MTETKLQSKWLVNLKGKAGDSEFEIAVVREDSAHSINSYGFFGKNKILISQSNGHNTSLALIPEIWDMQVKLAKEYAAKLNLEEFGSTEEVKIIRKSPFSVFFN